AHYHKQLADFNHRIKQNEIRYLLFVRLVPVFPFFLTNILIGLTLIPVTTFMWTTFVGIIPNVMVYACIGKQLTTLNKLSDILTPAFFLALLILTALSTIPLILKSKK